MKTIKTIISVMTCLAIGAGILSSHTASAETFNGYLDASTPCATHTITLIVVWPGCREWHSGQE